MVKTKTRYVCSNCGSAQPKWMGKCPDCGEWNSLVETVIQEATPGRPVGAALAVGGQGPLALPDIPADGYERIPVPIGELSRVLGGGLVPGSVVLISGDPGIGKCVTGDTRVLDPSTGDYLPITEYAAKRQQVAALDLDTYRIAPAGVDAFLPSGELPVITVRTRLGRTLTCTFDHPLLTPEGWHPVGQLPCDTWIACPRALPFFGHKALPPEQVKLIAYILSDGSAQSQVSVTNCLPDVRADLEEIARFFDVRLVVYRKQGQKADQFRFANTRSERREVRKAFAEALRNSCIAQGLTWVELARRADVGYWLLLRWRDGYCVPDPEALRRLAVALEIEVKQLWPESCERARRKTAIANFLEEQGLRFSRAANKRVPESVFRLPREWLALFLKTLFTCDGSVYVNGQGQPCISYSTISHRLAQDVQHLLLRFGLTATLRTKRSKVSDRDYTAYELVLLGLPLVRMFLGEIGIMGREEAVAAIREMSTPTLNSTRRDLVPTGPIFWEHLNIVRAGQRYSDLSSMAGVKIANRRHARPLCRSTVAALARVLPSPLLSRLGEGDVYWDQIESVTPAGTAPVYDISVQGYRNFVANDLIVHNSTLVIQLCDALAKPKTKSAGSEGEGPVLYVSGEESAAQIKLRAERLGIVSRDIQVLAETHLETISNHIQELQPRMVVVDSVQSIYSESIQSGAGSVTQVRDCSAHLLRLAKANTFPLFLVGHVTKEGAIAGPRILEHMVDTVLYLEGERFHSFRLLRSVKNRFGSTNEVGVFEMAESGLVEVSNPSEAFLAERIPNAPGSAIAVTMEGTRPILVEVQALSSATTFAQPRRTANGVDFNRLLLITAVLTKRARTRLADQDVFVNVIGGLQVDEPAADLAIATAVASSARNRPVAADLALVGEVGLSGELRSVGQLPRRLNEAAKLGFTRVLVPATAAKKLEHPPAGLQVLGARTLREALEMALVGSDDRGEADADAP